MTFRHFLSYFNLELSRRTRVIINHRSVQPNMGRNRSKSYFFKKTGARLGLHESYRSNFLGISSSILKPRRDNFKMLNMVRVINDQTLETNLWDTLYIVTNDTPKRDQYWRNKKSKVYYSIISKFLSWL